VIDSPFVGFYLTGIQNSGAINMVFKSR